MNIGHDNEYKYPQNLRCTYGDEDGKFFATVGCHAQTVRTNLADLGDSEERWERDATVVKNARSKGCKNV